MLCGLVWLRRMDGNASLSQGGDVRHRPEDRGLGGIGARVNKISQRPCAGQWSMLCGAFKRLKTREKFERRVGLGRGNTQLEGVATGGGWGGLLSVNLYLG